MVIYQVIVTSARHLCGNRCNKQTRLSQRDRARSKYRVFVTSRQAPLISTARHFNSGARGELVAQHVLYLELTIFVNCSFPFNLLLSLFQNTLSLDSRSANVLKLPTWKRGWGSNCFKMNIRVQKLTRNSYINSICNISSVLENN